MDNLQFIKAKLLFSLARSRKWGESHTAYEHVFRQFKSQSLSKDFARQATECFEELIKEGFILKKPTRYGLHISLNPNKALEIKQIIKEILGFEII